MSEGQDRLHHRLSVVWFTDLVGWSSIAARDEDRAIALVRRFQAAVRTAVPSDGGRIVKFIGDAALVESPSAESALRSAAALRDSMGEGEAVRTGIHLGDVAVAADGDLYGDGVNTAQRIQTEAKPGQIVVSEDVARGLRSRPAFRFESLGQWTLKGVAPMELFLVVGVEAPSRRGSTDPFPELERAARGVSAPARSIAVLPFANLSADVENEYFSDGITEEILTALTKLGGLKVISRTSVMQYKGTTKSVRQIGSELSVGAVLEGSIRRAGNRVRITAQLIEARTDVHLWAETYDRNLDDIFAIQTDVAEQIVDALRVQLSPREKARIAERPTESVEAYQWFLKGRYFLAKRTEQALRQAIDWFQKATQADPSFAQAWVGLAEGYALLPSYSAAPTAEACAEARAAAERALALDPTLGEAHAALGLAAQTLWNMADADREFRRAIDLSPGYATAHHWFGGFLSDLNRHDEAIAESLRALELDPLSLPVHNGLGTAYLFAGRLDDAIRTYRKVIEMEPGYLHGHLNLAETYDAQGRYAEAIEEWTATSRIQPERMPADLVADLRTGYETDGGRGYWEAWLAALRSREGFGNRPFYMAIACARLGRVEEAFEWLDRLVAERDQIATQLPGHPSFEALRGDPRYEELLRKINLA